MSSTTLAFDRFRTAAPYLVFKLDLFYPFVKRFQLEYSPFLYISPRLLVNSIRQSIFSHLFSPVFPFHSVFLLATDIYPVNFDNI